MLFGAIGIALRTTAGTRGDKWGEYKGMNLWGLLWQAGDYFGPSLVADWSVAVSN